MNGKGGLVEVALELEAGLADKFLVLRIALLGRVLAQAGQQPNGFEIDVENRVGFRQEPDGIGSGPPAQQDGGDNSAEDEKDGDRGPQVLPATSHG